MLNHQGSRRCIRFPFQSDIFDMLVTFSSRIRAVCQDLELTPVHPAVQIATSPEPHPVEPPQVPAAQFPGNPGPACTSPGGEMYIPAVVPAKVADSNGPLISTSLPQLCTVSVPRGPILAFPLAGTGLFKDLLDLLRAFSCASSSLLRNRKRKMRVWDFRAADSVVCTEGCEEMCADTAIGGCGTWAACPEVCQFSITGRLDVKQKAFEGMEGKGTYVSPALRR
jgi:hypothetical protein